MPSFTSQGPGSTRIASPIRGATLISPTKTTQVGERTKAREERIAEMVRQQRNGTWDGIPSGFSIVIDKNGFERVVQNIKSKDVRKPDEVTALTILGSPKTSTNKSSSEDEGLGEALHDLLNNSEGTPAVNRGSASPLPSLRGVDPNYNSDNAVDYGPDSGTDDEDLLRVFEDDNQPLGIQSQDAQHNNQPLGIQSQDTQRNGQPSGIREARTQTVQPVLTQQGVIDLVSNDAMTFAPGSGWKRRKQGYCDMLKGYESPNGNTVSVAVDLAALVIMSAVSETSIRNSLKLQQAANEKLLQQAEEHRALAQKQFTEGMARMQAEQEKTIAEAARIRNEYANSAKMAQVNFDGLMNKVEGKQNPNVISLQNKWPAYCKKLKGTSVTYKKSVISTKGNGKRRKPFATSTSVTLTGHSVKTRPSKRRRRTSRTK